MLRRLLQWFLHGGKGRRPPRRPAQQPSSTEVYHCNNDLCPHSYKAILPGDLVFGCLLCDRPARYGDLQDETKKQFTPQVLNSVWDGRVLCPTHRLALVPRCPACGAPIDRDGATPPIGIWGASFSGKTVYCAALLMEIERSLFRDTCISVQRMFDLRDYRRRVVDPLRNRGIVPDKTQPGEHHSMILKLQRDGLLRRKVTLTDMAGETYTNWFATGNQSLDNNARREQMFRTRNAIFLVSPESSGALGAAARRDVYPALSEVLTTLEDQGAVAAYGQKEMQRLLVHIEDKLNAFNFPMPDPAGGSYHRLSEELTRLTGRPADDPLAAQINSSLETVADKVAQIPGMEQQVDELSQFLSNWGFPRFDGKLDLRLAITVAKADLLPDIGLGYREIMRGLGPGSSREQWRDAIQRCSDISRSLLLRRGEQQFVEKAERNFHEIGIFFVSSLGRDTEAFVEADAAAAMSGSGSVLRGYGAVATAPVGGLAGRRWNLNKRARPGFDGTRQPDPQNVLLPLLWILMGEA